MKISKRAFLRSAFEVSCQIEQKRIPVVDAFSTIIPTLKYKVYVYCVLHALLGELVEYKKQGTKKVAFAPIK